MTDSSEAKTEAKTEVKTEAKTEVKTEAKTEVKTVVVKKKIRIERYQHGAKRVYGVDMSNYFPWKQSQKPCKECGAEWDKGCVHKRERFAVVYLMRFTKTAKKARKELKILKKDLKKGPYVGISGRSIDVRVREHEKQIANIKKCLRWHKKDYALIWPSTHICKYDAQHWEVILLECWQLKMTKRNFLIFMQRREKRIIRKKFDGKVNNKEGKNWRKLGYDPNDLDSDQSHSSDSESDSESKSESDSDGMSTDSDSDEPQSEGRFTPKNPSSAKISSRKFGTKWLQPSTQKRRLLQASESE